MDSVLNIIHRVWISFYVKYPILLGGGLMKIVTVKMPEDYIAALDELVKRGLFTSRSEAIRIAVRDLLMKELWEKSKISIRAYSRGG